MSPAISVVIPTFNWSAALRLAIRSVLLQSEPNFEIMVVGDGCTDDSAAVVAEFRDKRIRWHNLERNYGSQWAANNYAIENARGDWIAYLGHDDIWYPTHLEAILRAARTQQADIVTSVMALYGPPGSGVYGIAGLFATGAFSPSDFVPPSAFAHARALYGRGIRWRDPDGLILPVDAVFIGEAVTSAAKTVSTDELTVFKFNAAWRRDAYKLKPIDEQLRLLEKIQSGVDFRQSELMKVIQASVADKMIHFTLPARSDDANGAIVQRNRRYKGAESRFTPDELNPVETLTRFDMRAQHMPFEWHELEFNADGSSFRWSGPLPRATIDLPVIFDRDLMVRLCIPHAASQQILDTLTLSVHGHAIAHTRRQGDGSQILIEAVLRRDAVPPSDRDFGITLEVDNPMRPCDLGASSDRRWLGVAVGWVELAPE